MVSIRDRALVEARAKGLDIEAALKHPLTQLLKVDVVISAFAVLVMLLIYYTAVGFSLIYLTTVFGFSVKDGNGLGNWNWGFNVVAGVLVGIISDRFRVRKPFMVLGGIIAAVMVVVYLGQAGHHPSYYTVALMLALLSLGLGIAFAPWMASFTETVEARNPALTATGLAICRSIQRIVVFVSFLIIPAIVSTVTPLVTYGAPVQTYAAQYGSHARVRDQPPGDRGGGAEGPGVGDRHRDGDSRECDVHGGEDPAGRDRHRHQVQRAAGERAEVRPRAGRDRGPPGPVHQAAGRPVQPGPAGAGHAPLQAAGPRGSACSRRSAPMRPPSTA